MYHVAALNTGNAVIINDGKIPFIWSNRNIVFGLDK